MSETKLTDFEDEVLRFLSQYIGEAASDIDIAFCIFARRHPKETIGVIGMGGAGRYKLAANRALYRLTEKGLVIRVSSESYVGVAFTLTDAGRAVLVEGVK